MQTLRKGSRGDDVKQLQLALLALGKQPGDVDGIFGNRTLAAVIDVQDDYAWLEVDGIVGPQTWSAIQQALVIKQSIPDDFDEDAEAPDFPELSCSDETWQQFQSLVAVVTKLPVIYGPGRGLWHDGQFVITYGPGRLDSKSWSSKTGKLGPSFHCSSWTNFVMGVLARRNEDFTHAGNIPSLWDLCAAPNEPVTQQGVGTWRGYADICVQLHSDGSTRPRSGRADDRIIDLKELWARRSALPTFLVCGQSTKKDDGTWVWWHHTVLFVVDHRQADSPLYRIAADGRKEKNGPWSAAPMQYREVDDAYVAASLGKYLYRGYALRLPSSFDRPIAEVVFED